MYYKFSSFTQKLAGAWASEAYTPQVHFCRVALGRRTAARGRQSRGPSREGFLPADRSGLLVSPGVLNHAGLERSPRFLGVCCTLGEVCMALNSGLIPCGGQGDPWGGCLFKVDFP